MRFTYLFSLNRLMLTVLLCAWGKVHAVDIPLEVTQSSNTEAQYTVAYPWQQGNNWVMGLLQVKGGGEVSILKTSEPNSRREFMPIFSDFRTVGNRHYYFASYAPFEGKHNLPYREFCEFEGKDSAAAKCLQLDYLDPHDWLLAPNGDKIFMFAEPRKNWKGGFFEQRPLDFVLRRYAANGAVVWEWSSADKIPLNDRIVPSTSNAIRRIKNSTGIFSRLLQKTNNKLNSSFTFLLSKLGLLNTPLCVKYLRGCFLEPVNDYVHANSLEWDRDGNIVVSAAAQSKIFKIDYASGKILWTLGGYLVHHSDFKIMNDPLGGFSAQHSARILPNGNILLYDNGNMRVDIHARAAEYHLDMKNMVATLVWEYRSSDEYKIRPCCGAVERFPNGNTLIAWGGWEKEFGAKEGTLPVATEVNMQGQVVFEIRSKNFEPSYRVWRVH